MAGESAGSGTNTSRMASVPPVEAPIQMTFSVDSRLNDTDFAGAEGALLSGPSADFLMATGGAWACLLTCATDAVLILSTISEERSFNAVATPIRGLATKSIAPISSARMVISAPFSVRVETITTGMGRKRIRRDRKSRPSMRGISTSNVMTSGLSSRIISRATSGSLAAPTHSMSGCLLMISVSRLRTNAESSTTITLIFAILNPLR
jgi:hypothetical protein